MLNILTAAVNNYMATAKFSFFPFILKSLLNVAAGNGQIKRESETISSADKSNAVNGCLSVCLSACSLFMRLVSTCVRCLCSFSTTTSISVLVNSTVINVAVLHNKWPLKKCGSSFAYAQTDCWPLRKNDQHGKKTKRRNGQREKESLCMFVYAVNTHTDTDRLSQSQVCAHKWSTADDDAGSCSVVPG